MDLNWQIDFAEVFEWKHCQHFKKWSDFWVSGEFNKVGVMIVITGEQTNKTKKN